MEFFAALNLHMPSSTYFVTPAVLSDSTIYHHLRLYQYNHDHAASPKNGHLISMLPKAALPIRMGSQWKAHIILAISIKFFQESATISNIGEIFIYYDIKLHSRLLQQ